MYRIAGQLLDKRFASAATGTPGSRVFMNFPASFSREITVPQDSPLFIKNAEFFSSKARPRRGRVCGTARFSFSFFLFIARRHVMREEGTSARELTRTVAARGCVSPQSPFLAEGGEEGLPPVRSPFVIFSLARPRNARSEARVANRRA